MDNSNLSTNLNIKLYRLDDNVKSEIFKALNFYSNFDTTRNLMLLDRANISLMNEYDTINTETSMSVTVNEPSGPQGATGTNVVDIMYKQNVNNTLNAFNGFLEALSEKFPDDSILKLVFMNFQKMVKESLGIK